jgi:phosphoglycerate dehydrogenase-like enzyme
MNKIAILDDYQDVALKLADWKTLPVNTQLTVFNDHLDNPSDIAQRLNDFQIVCAMRERTHFQKDLLDKLPNLRLLITTGMRNAAIDTKYASMLGITVCGTDGLGYPTAELTWGLIISLARNIHHEHLAIKQDSWQTTLGIGLKGKTLGIIGLGNLGSQVSKIANAFGMNVIAWSQNLTSRIAEERMATLVTMEDLLTQSDFLTIHTILSERTRGLISKREIEMMKPTSFLINTSRGPIVKEDDLLDALSNNMISGAGLDVFDNEPLTSGHPLITLPNVLLTPHIGYVTKEGYEIYYSQTVECISKFLEGSPVRVLND